MKIISGVVLLLVSGSLMGCNTFRGVGKDVSSVGGGIEGTAKQTSEAIDRNTAEPQSSEKNY